MAEKVRVNISVDAVLLRKARKKLDLFGGKLSTLFNAYLDDFVKSMSMPPAKEHESLQEKIKDLEARIRKLEKG